MSLILGILLSSLSGVMHTSQTLSTEELQDINSMHQHFITMEDCDSQDSSPHDEGDEHDTKNSHNRKLVEQLYTVALRSSQARSEEYAYYNKLYTQFLQDALAVQQKTPHPPAFLSLASVYDYESYVLKFYSHNDALFHKLSRIRITIDHNNKERPYNILIPLLHTEKRNDIRVAAPCSYQEASGEISYALADIIKFTSENRTLHNRKAKRNICILTASSFTAITGYLTYYALCHTLSLPSFMYYSTATLGGHTALFLGLHYRRLRALDNGIKNDHWDIENRVVSSTKPMAALEPIIITLARSYAQYQIKKNVTLLSRRKLRGWLCCRPCLGAIYDYFKKPSDIEETIPERISSLLEKFHTKLSIDLETENKNHVHLPGENPAQLVEHSYRSILLTLHELQPTNLSNIIEQSGFYEENFTEQQLNFLRKSMNKTQKTLEQCLPTTIVKAAHITPPRSSSENSVDIIDDLEEIR